MLLDPWMLRANDGRRSDPTQRRGSCSRQRNFSLRSAICRTTPRSVSSGDGAERRECNSPHRRRVVKNSIAPGPVLRLAGPMSGFGTPRSRPRGRVAARPPLRVGARPRGVLGVQPTSRMTRQARLAAVAAAGGQLQGVAVAPRVVRTDQLAVLERVPHVPQERQHRGAEQERADGGDRVQGGEAVGGHVVVPPRHALGAERPFTLTSRYL